ncbi:hypothetical protein CXB51_017058 [Gossypium anomalum]|uniref:Uncharacterized protein n=1 Tax=Gossypium anomalum TaxID=47600 RepID=A0A8J5YGM7_9ROSI|nr:hypothetical protein CXB51_017058 [Gossypium anomalum]
MVLQDPFYFLCPLFFKKKKQNASSSLLPLHFSLLGIQPSLCHPGGSSVPRTSTPPPVHGSRPDIAAKISESRGVAECDAAAPLCSLSCNENRAKILEGPNLPGLAKSCLLCHNPPRFIVSKRSVAASRICDLLEDKADDWNLLYRRYVEIRFIKIRSASLLLSEDKIWYLACSTPAQ